MPHLITPEDVSIQSADKDNWRGSYKGVTGEHRYGPLSGAYSTVSVYWHSKRGAFASYTKNVEGIIKHIASKTTTRFLHSPRLDIYFYWDMSDMIWRKLQQEDFYLANKFQDPVVLRKWLQEFGKPVDWDNISIAKEIEELVTLTEWGQALWFLPFRIALSRESYYNYCSFLEDLPLEDLSFSVPWYEDVDRIYNNKITAVSSLTYEDIGNTP
jgi:hypothetical protein